MKRALLIAITATLILSSLALAQPSTWQSFSVEFGQSFSVTCPDQVVLLHIEGHELIGHCGAGGTVPPDSTVFQSPLSPVVTSNSVRLYIPTLSTGD